MLYRSITVAIMLLLSWFAYTSMQSMHLLGLNQSELRQIVVEKTEGSTRGDQTKINKKINEIHNFVAGQNKLHTEQQQLEKKLASQKKLTGFHMTYSQVLNAEILRSMGQLSDAAKLLKSTKKGIWKASDTYRDEQKALRDLMPKIDATVKAWNKGESAVTAKSVYVVLDKIIREKGKQQ